MENSSDLKVAWIREMGEDWVGINYEYSNEGFEKRGWSVTRFTNPDVPDMREGDIIHGTVEDIQYKLGDKMPNVSDYPEPLKVSCMYREIQEDTLENVRGKTGVFVKPKEHKLFSGFCAERELDWRKTKRLDDDKEIYFTPIVEDFQSEWRVYVLNGEVEAVGHYKGDPTVFPESHRIEKMLKDWNSQPVSFAMDVAVREIYGTVLMEVNEMMTAGVYGIQPVTYEKLIEKRWEEFWNRKD